MKTSILISGLAALCLVITFAKTTTRLSADKNNANPTDQISFVPVYMVRTVPVHKVTLCIEKTSFETTPVLNTEDFSYLKFNIADYMEKDARATIEPGLLPAFSDSDLSYLKFDANHYLDLTEASSFETIELPVNDFDYLRFDVNHYILTNTSSFETMELPSDNFNYLKFRVSEYIERNEMEAGIIGELPLAIIQPCISSNQ